ncbi:flagellar hook-length control protein FliK [Vibrio sp. 99-70-13A1]|uniref:flagellar hook-length control protein FliK n=1 Tax=Vibrio sp. 99-70-13A1 TaxID=2607601 RepID=UPI001493A8C5|nr:flagellar hook-length control protein FliK [Vibrio sp. 99-70-13A1]NOH95489.1 flagellar hook-length control protein FliK [Vibrio sp. 99-70-13A1]
MNISLPSSSTSHKTSSLLESNTADVKTEESGSSKGFFETLKEAFSSKETSSKSNVEPGKNQSDSKASEGSGDSSEKVVSDASKGKQAEETSSETKGVESSKSKVEQQLNSDESEEALLKQAKNNDEPELGKGDAKSQAALDSSKQQVVSDGKALKAAEASEGEVDEILVGKESKVVSESKTTSDTKLTQGSDVSLNKDTTQGQGEKIEAETAVKASAAMNEGNKLLGQLDEANKTLQPQTNGKALPPISSTEGAVSTSTVQSGQLNTQGLTESQVIGSPSSAADAGVTAGKAGIPLSTVPLTNSDQLIVKSEEQLAVEASEKSLMKLTQGAPVSSLSDQQVQQLLNQGVTIQQLEASLQNEKVNAELNQASNLSSSAALTANMMQSGKTPELSESDAQLVIEVDQHTQAINQLNAQISMAEAVVNELQVKQASGTELVAEEQVLLEKATQDLQALDAQLVTVTAQAKQLYTEAFQKGIISQESYNQVMTNQKGDDSQVAAESEHINTIAWGSATSDVKVTAEGKTVTENTLATKTAQTGVAASVQQALAQNASAADKAMAASSASVASTGLDNTAAFAQTTQFSSVPDAALSAAKASPSEAVLKAGISGAALAGLSKTTQKDDGKEGTLAQQIAAASGQQGMPSTAPTRAEIQAAQQAPLQLTKELANEQVAEKVQMMMSKNLKNLDIRLDPPELGRMQIRMTMNNDIANVHFTVANQQARDIIEQTLPRLREMLAQQGLQLAESSVQQQSSGQGQDRYNSGGNDQQSGGNRTNDGQGGENLESDVNLELNVASKRDGISYYA